MSGFILLLRGINVGKANRLAMATLSDVLQSLGARQVQTLLNSGNAVFQLAAADGINSATQCSQLADQIAAALLLHTGLDLHCVVKSAAQWQQIDRQLQQIMADLHPEPSRFLIGISRDNDTLQQFKTVVAPSPQLTITEQALYLYCPDGINQSPYAEQLVSKKWRLITCRNLATFEKISRLCAVGHLN